ncbi:histidine--tRNA ligase [Coxiella endosymbiont of Amblyomma nuttalli]|uniref:histidine--tRNA ligase n=1 Tax=Coxiella endosymbiont of Amblyomma nuttalli TaxID=2749996 RepID=UPI00350FE59E
MNDLLPEVTPYWSFLEASCHSLVKSYGYQEIRFPIVEQTALFKRTIGEISDIVQKEMYTFLDRNGDSLSLRPEGTAGCVRAGIQHSLFHNNQTQRLWYIGPMFRHERPQKGRYRQFYQFGVEAYGMSSALIDAELILMCFRLWKTLGLDKFMVLGLNTLGTRESRARYREKLATYLQSRITEFNKDDQRRLTINPLRILDSKNPHLHTVIAEAPKLQDYLDDESRQRFDQLLAILDSTKIAYIVNPTLVRGFDYYTHTVFEWFTNKLVHQLGAQNAVCGGGRYDTLVKQLGGKPIPAVGFAAGLERLALLLRAVHEYEYIANCDIYLVANSERAVYECFTIAERLRDALPMCSIKTHLSGGSFKSQFKRADKSGAKWVIVIGDEEIETKTVTLKHLREELPQKQLGANELIAFLRERIT